VNFDFSTFSVQVPTIGSAANAALVANNEPRSSNVRSFLMTDSSPDLFCMFGALREEARAGL
jgi:hypothetical protein